MINRKVLARFFKATQIACFFHPFIATMYVYVAWVLSSDGAHVGAGSRSATASPITLAAFALLALSPILLAPLAKSLFANGRRRAARDPDLLAVKPEALLGNQIQLEYSVWATSSAAGFFAFVLGAGWIFFLACIGVGLVGYVVSFPKWSQAEQYADEYDKEVRSAQPSSAT